MFSHPTRPRKTPVLRVQKKGPLGFREPSAPSPMPTPKEKTLLSKRQLLLINLDPIILGENYGREKPIELTFSLDTNITS